MKIPKRFFVVLVTLLLSAALFAACGDPTATPVPPSPTKAPTTAAPTTAPATTAAPTTAPATTVAPTTAPATTVAPTTAPATTAPATTVATGGGSKVTPISGAPKAPVAQVPQPSGTPEAKETVPPSISVSDNDPFLALLGKIGAASNNAKSLKFSMTVNATSGGSNTQINAAAILTETDDVDMVVESGGQQFGLVILGNNYFLNSGGAWSQVTDQSQLAPFKFIFNTVAYVIPNQADLNKFAGSTFTVYPNEKLDDGTPVGYLVLDTSTASDATVKQLGTVVYVYDPKTYLISSFYSTSPTLTIAIAIGDYNDPSNVVQNPLTGGATTSSSTPAATTTTAASSSADIDLFYPGSTPLALPEAITKQFESSVGSSVKNPQVAALTTPDSADKIKAYYLEVFKKNGWTDIAAKTSGFDTSQLETAGGFGLIYNKDKQVVVIIGLPAASASALGITNAPSTGTLLLGFAGEAV